MRRISSKTLGAVLFASTCKISLPEEPTLKYMCFMAESSLRKAVERRRL